MGCQRKSTSSIEADAAGRANQFVSHEQAFHLGFLPTEQSHPLTEHLSATISGNMGDGIDQLFAVDGDIAPVARRAVVSREFDDLVRAICFAVDNNGRIVFSGCGSTGRLSIMLEAMWRTFWEQEGKPDIAGRAYSIMTGGDRALIRSVESFEDYAAFGRRQALDAGIEREDVLIAITEGGETSSVIGTVHEALHQGATVFFVYNNPRTILVDQIERSRTVIDNPGVTSLDLSTGPMALSGSTRMQATTIEMLVVGVALEEAIAVHTMAARDEMPPDQRYRQRLGRVDTFARTLARLRRPDNREVIAQLAMLEADLYRQGGRITYFAEHFLLDIFSDTTERSPTFKLPPFRRSGDEDAPVSWAFAKDPCNDSAAAWLQMLGRPPRGIDWSADDYRRMAAPQELVDNPPVLSSEEILRYAIGRETDPSRWSTAGAVAMSVVVGDDKRRFNVETPNHVRRIQLSVGRSVPDFEAPDTEASNSFVILVDLPDSPIQLYHHLVLKLVFNTLSTASMARIGRIRGNWMIQVDPTNKKLIDRATRIVAAQSGLDYKDACRELYKSILSPAAEEVSPVVQTLARCAGSEVLTEKEQGN